MAKKICIIAMLMAILALSVGCGTTPTEIELNESDNGCHVDLEKGQDMVITLESNPSTGYTWEITEVDESILKLVDDEYQQSNPDDDLVGEGGWQILHFEAADVGQTALEIVYHRPWEEGVEPLETFAIQVVVS